MKGQSRPKRTRQRAAAKAKPRPSLSKEAQNELETAIGYRFKDDGLLQRALTHPSLTDEYSGGARFSNQRLEFLGDRVLGLVIAEWLTLKYPKEREGHLTKVYHTMVSGETCAAVGETFQLRDYMFFDASMQKNTSGHYDKAVGDAVEALIAAVYKDGGLDKAEAFIKRVWVTENMPSRVEDVSNPKTRLSDWCGAHRAPYAVYETVSQDGPHHAPIFTVKATIEGHGEAIATGRSKQEAETAAAAALLEDLLAE
ncbi:MAG: ribonuclease III [Pseudomonadota bacterium]